MKTRATQRTKPLNRVVLDFEAVQIQPVEFLGIDLKSLPPLGFDLPRASPWLDAESSPGYFDVLFRDDEMVVIRQNSPGGIFVLVKVADDEP